MRRNVWSGPIGSCSEGRRAEAEAELLRALEIRPEDAAANDRIGRLYWEAGETEKAVASLKRAAGDEEYSERSCTLQTLGEALAAARRYDEAAAALLRSLALLETADGYAALARVFAQADEANGAAMALNTALQLDPNLRSELAGDPLLGPLLQSVTAPRVEGGGPMSFAVEKTPLARELIRLALLEDAPGGRPHLRADGTGRRRGGRDGARQGGGGSRRDRHDARGVLGGRSRGGV